MKSARVHQACPGANVQVGADCFLQEGHCGAVNIERKLKTRKHTQKACYLCGVLFPCIESDNYGKLR